MTSQTPGVLFDIDGTLCDTNYLHAVAWKRALSEHGFTVSTAAIHAHIGMGSDQMLDALLSGEFDEEKLVDSYSGHIEPFLDDFTAFPYAGNLLRAVNEMGARAVLATSAQPSILKRLRGAINADEAIHDVTSSGDVDNSKPAPDVFTVAMRDAQLTPELCVAVGDTVWDIKAAGDAGIGCIAVLTGGIARETLLDAGAIAVYDDVAQLLKHLPDSPIGALGKRSE